jgi:hypothetical protein
VTYRNKIILNEFLRMISRLSIIIYLLKLPGHFERLQDVNFNFDEDFCSVGECRTVCFPALFFFNTR